MTFSKPCREASKLRGWGLYCLRNVTFQSVLSSLRGFCLNFFPPHGVESRTHASCIFSDGTEKRSSRYLLRREAPGSPRPPPWTPRRHLLSCYFTLVCRILLSVFVVVVVVFVLFLVFLQEHLQLNYLWVNNPGNRKLVTATVFSSLSASCKQFFASLLHFFIVIISLVLSKMHHLCIAHRYSLRDQGHRWSQCSPLKDNTNPHSF